MGKVILTTEGYVSSLLPSGFTAIDCVGSFRGIYGINESGDIYSVRKLGLLKRCKHSLGYEQVYLTNFMGGGRWYKVHRLVALQFIPNPDSFTDINHINGVKTDNRVDNLEWCTHSANILHSYRSLGRVAVCSHSKKRVKCSNGIVYESGKLAALATGCKSSNVSMCCSGKLRQTNGFEFSFCD